MRAARPDGLRPRLARRGRGRERRHARGAPRAPTGSTSCAGSCPTSADEIARGDRRARRATPRSCSRPAAPGSRARDVTPEATRSVLEREAPGIAEAIRADSIAKTPHGLLSRGVAGTVGATLVVNLAGSPGACRDGYAVLAARAPHALEAARRPENRDRPRPHLDRAPRTARRSSSRAWSRSSTRSSRCRSPTSARCSPSTGSRRRTTCSGSRSRWSAPARSRWR